LQGAQVTDEGPRIISDTRVTFRDARRPSFKAGMVKTVIVSREVAISFAGDLDIALSAVRAFAERVNSGPHAEDVERELSQPATKSRGAVEFIIASAVANSRLIRIRDSGIERDLLATWIGDSGAFEQFQSVRNRLRSPSEMQLLSSLPNSAQVMTLLNEAMRAVIADRTIGSVDDFCVAVASKPGGFNYFPSTFVHLGRDIELRDGDDLVSKMAQSVAEGGYAVSIVEPLRPGTAALGQNFPRASLGIVYLPLLFDEGQIVNNVSANDFPEVVRDLFGVDTLNEEFPIFLLIFGVPSVMAVILKWRIL
jgi:hypothetical protein